MRQRMLVRLRFEEAFHFAGAVAVSAVRSALAVPIPRLPHAFPAARHSLPLEMATSFR